MLVDSTAAQTSMRRQLLQFCFVREITNMSIISFSCICTNKAFLSESKGSTITLQRLGCVIIVFLDHFQVDKNLVGLLFQTFNIFVLLGKTLGFSVG